MATPIIHVGDIGPLVLAIKDKGVIVDLTGVTPVTEVLQTDGATLTQPVTAVTDAANGLITVTMVAGTFPDNGDHILQMKLTHADWTKRTRRFPVPVLPTVGGAL